ncbi:MAG: hypothetical protein F6K23_21585 [Okeania sp. SIO2C9]|uniref:hypothetical protein n=1 Tax=Okeania sp. SIO2C9 TaxID=2607791 RepID=UPI0013C0C671|nr:hypothetical protein [Okeania sp. SIO2C9]NEQ75413.1 hypothetical protein [Okeania sp. SIO2C9]
MFLYYHDIVRSRASARKTELVRNQKGQVMTVLGEGEKPKAEKPLSVKVTQDIDEYLRSL